MKGVDSCNVKQFINDALSRLIRGPIQDVSVKGYFEQINIDINLNGIGYFPLGSNSPRLAAWPSPSQVKEVYFGDYNLVLKLNLLAAANYSFTAQNRHTESYLTDISKIYQTSARFESWDIKRNDLFTNGLYLSNDYVAGDDIRLTGYFAGWKVTYR